MPQPDCHASGARPDNTVEVADIFRHYGPAYRDAHRLPLAHLKVMHAIEACRTSDLGGHRERCMHCGFVRYAYNSCRNRHCPKCQALVKARWLQQRRSELLPVPYFHTVLTLPHQINPLILCREQNQRLLLKLLFQSAAQTLLQFARTNLGGTLGITMVLHTWDQQLRPHFHVHCLIPGGVLSADRKQWIASHPRFLFADRALSKVFGAKFRAGLRLLYRNGQLLFPAHIQHLANLQTLLSLLQQKDWVVHTQPPFAGPQKLLDYLGRYMHRVAICNSRIVSLADGQVQFHYRDRADGDQRKTASLPAHEFIRRFLYHVLPTGFMRIRHYGLFANRFRKDNLKRCRQLLDVPPSPAPQNKSTAEWIFELAGIDITVCPQCGKRSLHSTQLTAFELSELGHIRSALARAPPNRAAS